VIVDPDQETFQSSLRRKQHYEYVEDELLKTALCRPLRSMAI